MFPFCRQRSKKKTGITLKIKKMLGSNKTTKFLTNWNIFTGYFLSHFQCWCSDLFIFYRTASCEYMWDFHINGFLLSPDIYLFIPQPRDEAPFIYL